ncbi:LOW QUALITY PROTEIN: mitotic checkpoint serine/threonine-protein kinase BUB1-like [Sphaeramia orbicularis]|uniref:LOW QUALITY PROTEIN: mitotic checkpoint serine/threonine-protein kinase BUB1-like n=1 Tax=Sphaeramia orbicularis TaxID=375764 RepID=UPI0011809ACD|nr:LOW QUALITY PROTEIN: mitotic checkpoint serine/threonine-protein kinase BUB1-like [Sphaeramia orbicularis]
MMQPLQMNQGPAHNQDQDGTMSHHVDLVQTSGSERDPSRPLQLEDKLNTSQGGVANLSHVTPNTSLGFVQATPSRMLPSPTVNTREALDVIMDMFQAPTLLEETFSNTLMLHASEKEPDPGLTRTGVSSLPKAPPTSAPFTIFQDSDDKENCSSARPAGEEVKPVQALAEIPVSRPCRPNETSPDLMPDDSTMWGAAYNSLNSLAACPNSTSDFAMLAQFVSTPFTHKTFFSSNFSQDQENCDGADGHEEAFVRRQTKKLSPIIEQSPSEEKLSDAVSQLQPLSSTHGTIVGEGLAPPPTCLASSSTTMVQPPPPAVLSFRDHTLCPTDASIQRTVGPGWEVYASPGPDPQSYAKPRGAEPFTIMEDLDRPGSQRVHGPAEDVPMSPESVPRLDWLSVRSPEHAAEPDLDAFLSPRQPKTPQSTTISRTRDVPMSPQLQLYVDVPMSPAPQPPSDTVDEPMMSPDRGAGLSVDVSMTPKTLGTARLEPAPLFSDPWDNELISGLLSALNPPLTSHPHCISWQGNVPNIRPRTTISMGKASLRVDCILGEGAFATVYQATDPMTSERMVLKVQKPANPWEFYINTQLDVRLQPNIRHLYSRLSSAHLFHDGSVLLGELHSYGTLLNVVNLYKCGSDKVMPQPLVLYFSICILHMVEQLHSVNIIHADIKPDNFLLGERFLENKCFDPNNMDHGLVLIDLGQSIDMELFPRGTAFTAACQTSGFQCTEMQSGKPWNYQTDYFGVAGTVYCLLFGTYMQVTTEDGVWRTNAVFRRNPHSDLWLEFFHTLLNVPDCWTLADLTALRQKLTSVLLQNYSSKLSTLKSRLVVLLLENRKAAKR